MNTTSALGASHHSPQSQFKRRRKQRNQKEKDGHLASGVMFCDFFSHTPRPKGLNAFVIACRLIITRSREILNLFADPLEITAFRAHYFRVEPEVDSRPLSQ